jgi:hypothetical protein
MEGGAPGSGFNDPGSLTMSSLEGGGGGGGGANCAYYYYYGNYVDFYGGSSGGGGGGAIGIETTGTFTMGSAGKIVVTGGSGGNYSYNAEAGAGGGGAGGTVLVRADTVSLSSGAAIDARGGAGGISCGWSYEYYFGNNGGIGGVGTARFEAATLPGILNTGAILGYSSTTGSLYTSYFRGGGDTGAILWQEAAGLAPDFHSGWASSAGSVHVYLEGAMADPVTGLRSASRMDSFDLTTGQVTRGLAAPDAIDGYRYWRLLFRLGTPTSSAPDLPEVYESGVSVDTK